MKNGTAFFIPMDEVPTSTAQEKGFRIVGGHVMVFEKPRAKEAKEILTMALRKYIPDEPMQGPVRLTVQWYFRNFRIDKKTGKKKTVRPNGYRTTKPDTDNLNKGLKDVMTKLGFWNDDAQVCEEMIGKYWSSNPGILIIVEDLTEEKPESAIKRTETYQNQAKA